MGDSPRKYRNNPFWSFKNFLGRREININYPVPKICHLKGKVISGKAFDYKELILYSGVNTKARWGKLYDYLKNNNTVTVSNRLPFNDKGSDIIAKTIVWTEKEYSNCNLTIDEGLYAQFTFTGTIDEYIIHMYNIYYNSLPIYNLDKRDAYDIEYITKDKSGVLCCQYYLPIYSDKLQTFYMANNERVKGPWSNECIENKSKVNLPAPQDTFSIDIST